VKTEGRPTDGVRIELERRGDAAVGFTYEGSAHLPSRSLSVVAMARTDGVDVTLDEGLGEPLHTALAKTVGALVRAATKRDLAAGRTPPRSITRWRPFETAGPG
jgi:hypothetical protein